MKINKARTTKSLARVGSTRQRPNVCGITRRRPPYQLTKFHNSSTWIRELQTYPNHTNRTRFHDSIHKYAVENCPRRDHRARCHIPPGSRRHLLPTISASHSTEPPHRHHPSPAPAAVEIQQRRLPRTDTCRAADRWRQRSGEPPRSCHLAGPASSILFPPSGMITMK